MNFKRDTYSQDEDAVKYRTGFFHRLNNDPTFSVEYRKKVDLMLSRSFEREQHKASEQTQRGTETTTEAKKGLASDAAKHDSAASKQNGAGTEVNTEATTGSAAEAAEQDSAVSEQNRAGTEVSTQATPGTVAVAAEQGKVVSEQNGVGTEVSEQAKIATGSGEQNEAHRQKDQFQASEENTGLWEHNISE